MTKRRGGLLVLLLLACGPERRVISDEGHAGETATGGSGVGGTSGANGGATGGMSTGGTSTGGTGLDAGAAGDDGGGDSTGGDAGAATGGKAGNMGTGGAMGGGSAGVGGRGGAAGAGGSSGGGVAGASGGGMGGADPPANEWATWPMPNPASTGLPNPHSYTDNGDDGTVSDNVTGLVWQQNVGAGLYNWQGAKQACRFPDGSRLPSVIEMVSLVDYTQRNPGIDPIFGLFGRAFWTSSEMTSDPSSAWSVSFGEGITLPSSRDSLCPVLCVRAGAQSSMPHYETVTIGATQAVRDNWTGLVWEQPISASMYDFAGAVSYCLALGVGWRAPSMKELQSLVDRRRNDPSIDPTHFPNTPSAFFWTSTEPPDSDVAWSVSFVQGYTNTYFPGNAFRVRCVR